MKYWSLLIRPPRLSFGLPFFVRAPRLHKPARNHDPVFDVAILSLIYNPVFDVAILSPLALFSITHLSTSILENEYSNSHPHLNNDNR